MTKNQELIDAIANKAGLNEAGALMHLAATFQSPF